MKASLLFTLGVFLAQTALAQHPDRTESLVSCSSPFLRGGSNLVVDSTYTAEELVMDFFANSCIAPFNITFTGSGAGKGYFQAAGTDLGLPGGIQLQTGNVGNAVGPNNQNGAGNSLGKGGDLDLTLLCNQNTFDAQILEFDFISSTDSLNFKYVFASEEYPEYVCAMFNDVFGFFLSGPGLEGPFSEDAVNIAYIPGTSIYVGVNSINPGVSGSFGNTANCESGSLDFGFLYHDNLQGQELQADGFTVPLSADVVVVPGAVYHAKIAVADAGDGVFDSAVFLSVESLCGDSVVTPVAEFKSPQFSNANTVMLDGRVKYSFNDWTWSWGDGTPVSVGQGPMTHTYSKPGLYEVRLWGANYCCSDTASLSVPIQLPPYISGMKIDPVTCAGATDGRISLNVISSYGKVDYLWSDGSTESQRTNLYPGSYWVTLTDTKGQTKFAGPFIVAEPAPVAVAVLMGAPSEEDRRVVHISPKGGVTGWTVLWSDGSTAWVREDLIAGKAYSYTVTNPSGCIYTETLVNGSGQPGVPIHDMFIVPNPVRSSFRLSVPGDLPACDGVVTVYNAVGRLVTRVPWNGLGEEEIHTTGWPEGAYVVVWQCGPQLDTRWIRVAP